MWPCSTSGVPTPENGENKTTMTKKESEIKYISRPVGTVYERLADLRNLQVLKDRIDDPQVQAMMASQVPTDKIEQVKNLMEKMEFTADSVDVDSPLGHVTLNIVEREEPKLLKFGADGAPIPLNLWIQLLPTDEQNCKLKVTVGAEVNLFMKAMVGKPLQQAADGLAQVLAVIPY